MIKKFSKFKKRKKRVLKLSEKDPSYNWVPLRNDASPSPGTNISIGLIKDYN
jgi:hypothetical protein